MNNLTQQQQELLTQISDLHEIPQGSYSIRKDGQTYAKNSTEDIEIIPKQDKNGIDIFIKPGVKNKSLHIPVIITESGLKDVVYNDFHIGKEAEVTIVAGCGIHNDGQKDSEHNGVHSFHLEKNCKVKYLEKHLAQGKGSGEKMLNPTTRIKMEKGSYFEMETLQLGGVTYSDRKTSALLSQDAKLLVKEKILTENKQIAKTLFNVSLKGKNSSVEVISRSVAKDHSKQKFVSVIRGKNECFGHVECDGILLDKAIIESSPKVVAEDIGATLVHEAAIGKIAGEQIIKLQSLGLTEEEAQNEIIKGFLK